MAIKFMQHYISFSIGNSCPSYKYDALNKKNRTGKCIHKSFY